MNKQAILHIPMSQYAYGAEEDCVVFRLRTAKGDLTRCTLVYGDRACRRTPVDYFRAEMTVVLSDSLFDWWEARLHTDFTRLCYAFALEDIEGEKCYYYGDLFFDDLTADRSAYFQLPFNHRADRVSVPAWMRDAVVYNIFPDSFATGRRYISGKPAELPYHGHTVRGKLGGTLRGVADNLDYISEMGFNCIYLNPVFAAGEYHKYDLLDYYHIDPAFGTDEDFRALVKAAHEKGIRVMIDGVFNHCGWHFFAFEDAVRNGKESRYWNWFYHLREPVFVPDNMEDYPNYECFGYERMMPKMACDNPEVQAYFCGVGEYWVREFDIDGWRLDVASEINDGFWRAFRKAVKAVKPDCALIGEVWESAGHWLDGSMFDSTMNYDFRKHCAAFFAAGGIDAGGFHHRSADMLMRYRDSVAYGQLNLLDSHDVSRFLSLCGEDIRRQRLAVLFQMTFIGMPCVFYGDELGMAGVLEEEYRHPMPWEEAERGNPLWDFYKRAIALRNEEPALRRGNFSLVKAEGGLYVFCREYRGERLTVAMNASGTEKGICPGNGEMLWQSGREGDILQPSGFYVMKG